MGVSVILGAGFSYPAGLPLTNDLFVGDLPALRNSSPEDRRRMLAVREAFIDWSSRNPDGGTERWLREMYQLRKDPLMAWTAGTEWGDIVQYILRRMVPFTRSTGHTPYYYGATRYSMHAAHREFWLKLLSSDKSLSVITFNYDLLAEQALNFDDGSDQRPRFYYGGLPWGTHLKKMVNVAAEKGHKHLDVELGEEVPIYKLHGSINWAFEPHSFSMKVHDDVRAAFRRAAAGVPAIIPPVEEKEMSEDFAAIWAASRRQLSAADHWVVVGYSLADYDIAARNHFARAAAESDHPIRISVLDPHSSTLVGRWMLPNVAKAEALEGLPNGVTNLVP